MPRIYARTDRYQHPGLPHLTKHHRDLTVRVSLPHRHFPFYQHLTPPAHYLSTRYPNAPSPQPQCPHHAILLNLSCNRQHSQKLFPSTQIVHRPETLDPIPLHSSNLVPSISTQNLKPAPLVPIRLPSTHLTLQQSHPTSALCIASVAPATALKIPATYLSRPICLISALYTSFRGAERRTPPVASIILHT